MGLLATIAAVLLRRNTGGVRAPSTGRKQRAKSPTAKARLPNLSRYYDDVLREVEPGAFTFNVQLLRGRGLPVLGLDEFVESIEWSDEQAQMVGSITFRRSDPERPREVPILAGHQVRLRVLYRGSWRTLWTMRAASPSITLSESEGSVELSDDLDALTRSRRRWEFRKSKGHKGAWKAHEVAAEVARVTGLRVRRLAAGETPINKLVETTSALGIIRRAYRREREKTGRRFIIRLVDGELEVAPFERNRVLYVFCEQIIDALTSAEIAAHPTTVIDARGRIGKGRSAKKVERRVYREAAVKRFGWVVRERNYGKVDSVGDLEEQAKRDLADALRASRTAELTVPGVPFLRRGDGIRWPNREPGWYGKEVEHSRDRTYVYIRGIRHAVTAGGYTTTMTVVQDDPFHKDRERRDEEARDRAEKRRRARKEKG